MDSVMKGLTEAMPPVFLGSNRPCKCFAQNYNGRTIAVTSQT